MKLTEFHGLVTASDQMRAVFELVRRVAPTDATVLLRGETGTGKELVGRALHALSDRGAGVYRAINCATLTPELLASELFGHVRGAFTGAVRSRAGLFALADGGTLLLDEVAEIPPDIQARLLRVLQERTFVPVGGTEPVRVDVRILSATHKALRREVAERRFRADLMYRIRVVPIFLPPLRDRTGDVEALSEHFIQRFNERGLRRIEAVSPDALDAMLGYAWPGNVRELRNVVEYAFAIGRGPTLTVDQLPPELRGEPPPEELHDPAPDPLLLERARIQRALREHGHRKGLAADALGVSRTTLWRRMRELGIPSRAT